MSQPALDKSDRAISEIIRVFNSANEDDIATPNVVTGFESHTNKLDLG